MNIIFKTDAYCFTMLSSLVEENKADDPAVFELFARKLPSGRRFGINAGLGRFLREYREWTITTEDITNLQEWGYITPKTATWLTARVGKPLFSGNIWAYQEGDLYWAYSPLVRVEGPLGEAILLETLLLSIYNHDTAVASAAARMVLAASGRPLIEMGSRRTEEHAAVSAARAAYIAGFARTSNMAAREEWGIPTSGTAAHAFTLAHENEEDAFLSQLRTWGQDTTLLVDTYDTPQGIKRAVHAANSLGFAGPGAIRIDSGDLAVETQEARRLLDSLDAEKTRIVVSSDLDEFLIAELATSPIDGYGAGTRVVTGSGHPTAGFVYKLVEINGRPVAKKSHGKISVGGRKFPYRRGEKEFYTLTGDIKGEPLQCLYIEDGKIVPGEEPSLQEVRIFTQNVLNKLPSELTQVSAGSAGQIVLKEE